MSLLPLPKSLSGMTGTEILTCAAALRAACPGAEPVAFWDFDGTLFEGDCSEGFVSEKGEAIAGLVETAVLAGWSRAYPAAGGFAPCWEDYRATMQRDSVAAAYLQLVKVFSGAPEGALRDLAGREFSTRLRPWFFAEALDLWAQLEAGGVRCMVISASADFFVKGAAEVLGVPPDRLHGLRLATGADGFLTDEPLEPVTIRTGKARLVSQLLTGTRHAIAAFGNDLVNDGPMLEAVASVRLPGGTPGAFLVNDLPPARSIPGLAPLTFARRTFR